MLILFYEFVFFSFNSAKLEGFLSINSLFTVMPKHPELIQDQKEGLRIDTDLEMIKKDLEKENTGKAKHKENR